MTLHSSDGKMIASASRDRTVRLWDANSGQQIRVLDGHSDAVKCVAFSPDAKTLASSLDWGDTIRLWDVDTGKHISTLKGHTHSINSIVFSPDGKLMASGSSDGTVLLWDLTLDN